MPNSLVLFFSFILFSAYSHSENITKNSEEIPEYQIKRYQKDFEPAFKQGTIKITNHYGNVTVKNTTHHTVGLAAVVQEIGSEPSIHNLKIKELKNKLIIEVKYPQKEIKKHKRTKSGFSIGRVDLVFFIPVDYRIDVQTSYGKIDFKRVKNPIKSRSKSGAINVSSYYDMQAETDSGQIKAFPMGTQWDRGIKLKSKSGTIYAIIPVNANVELDVKTKGSVFSQLQSISEWSAVKNKLKKSYGQNGKSYRIQNNNGDVYLSPHESVK
ncbi:MAG: DUF4097 family beta strand repeat-containing protein [Marinicellaceae bacterium]